MKTSTDGMGPDSANGLPVRSRAAFAKAIPCHGEDLVAIVHPADPHAKVGAVIVVGGPQYRAGSHRQFVLLARALADAGIPAIRFDTRGMGDSGGSFPGFEGIEPDIRAAIDGILQFCPGLERVVLWGLCDAASAILLYAFRDPRVAGLVLLNPWVRTDTTYARAQLRHYYAGKIADPAFWRRLLTGGVAVRDAARSLWQRLCDATRPRCGAACPPGSSVDPSVPLPERMAQGLAAFDGPVLLILSGNDLTAREFEDVAAASPAWASLLSRRSVTTKHLPDADHTFSRAEWSAKVEGWTRNWIQEISGKGPAVPSIRR